MDKVFVVVILIEVLQVFCNSFLTEIKNVLEGYSDVIKAKRLEKVVQGSTLSRINLLR